MNEHIELLISSRQSSGHKAAKIALIVATVVAAILFFMTQSILVLLVAVAAGFGAYYLGLRSEIEYEYAITESDMDVDAIFSKQTRKHIITLDLKKMEVCAPINSYHLDEYKNRQYKSADYSSRNPENQKNMYVMYYNGEKKFIFELDDRFVNAIYNQAPRKVFRE